MSNDKRSPAQIEAAKRYNVDRFGGAAVITTANGKREISSDPDFSPPDGATAAAPTAARPRKPKAAATA